MFDMLGSVVVGVVVVTIRWCDAWGHALFRVQEHQSSRGPRRRNTALPSTYRTQLKTLIDIGMRTCT